VDELGGLDHVTEQLRVEELKFDYLQLEQRVAKRVTHAVIPPTLNEEAIANLSNSKPTCNTCRELMTGRNGKFGRFYYCKCPEQKTVNHDYWRKIREQV
jgi:hypothetical protein